MKNRFLLSIAGITVEIITRSPAAGEEFLSRFSPFLGSVEKLSARIEISCRNDFSLKPEAGDYWPLSISLGSNISVKSLGLEGYFSADYGGIVSYRCGEPELLENFFRVLFAFLLVDNEGVLLHAAGVEYENAGYVFVGQSGAGKSTIARLLKGRGKIYSDDIVAVIKRNGKYLLFSTPFRGEETLWLAENRGVELRKVFVPIKSSRTYTVVADRGDAVSKLIANAPFIHDSDRHLLKLLDFVEKFVKKIPVYKLYFEKNAPVWEVI